MKQLLILIALGLLLTSCESNSEKSASAVVDFDPAPWILQGQDIQKRVFEALSSQLTTAMAEGGVTGALTYCQIQAYPLTDSLSNKYGVSIRRATNQPRNPNNKALPDEVSILSQYSKTLLAGNDVQPMAVEEEDGGISYYGPIRIQPLCLNCHGTPGKELNSEDHALIKSLYPDDQAIGYQLGDLRGVWHLQWHK